MKNIVVTPCDIFTYIDTFNDSLTSASTVTVLGPEDTVLLSVQKQKGASTLTDESTGKPIYLKVADREDYSAYGLRAVYDAHLPAFPTATGVLLDGERRWPLGKEYRSHTWYRRFDPQVVEVPAGTALYHCSDDTFAYDPARLFFCAEEEHKSLCRSATRHKPGGTAMQELHTVRPLRLATLGHAQARHEYLAGDGDDEVRSSAPYNMVEELLAVWCAEHGFDGWRAICMTDAPVSGLDEFPSFESWFENCVTREELVRVMEAHPAQDEWWPEVLDRVKSGDEGTYPDDDGAPHWDPPIPGAPAPLKVFREAINRAGGPDGFNRRVALAAGHFEIAVLPHLDPPVFATGAATLVRKRRRTKKSPTMSALPLITFDPETSRYACDERAMAMLRDLPGPVGVVACAGRYRTGKSFLLNRVLLGKKNGTGFGVGNTVHACTKGLWIWSEPLRNRKNMRVLVVDTEGIGALDASSVHDTRIFALAVLLSSSFFFNSVGSIDDAAVQTLSLVCALSKHIKISSSSGGGDDGVEESPEALAAFFPEFLWIVRDFTLQLVTKTGEPLSEHDYLEEALRDVPATLEDADQKNQTRRLLRTYFRNRDCLTLVRPTSKEADLQKLDHVARLRPEFVRKGKVLRRRLIDECPPKSMGGTSLNGAMLARLCELFTTALNNGGVPVMDDALTSILRLRVQKVAQDARSWFDDRARVVPCTTPRDVGQRLAKLVDSTLARFDREVAREDAGVAARTEREALHLALRRTMEERIRTARETHRVKVRSVAERELRRGIMALGATAASASSTDGADDAALARMLAHVEATLTGGGGGAAADDGGGNGDDDMHAEPARAALWGALRMLLDEEPEVRRHFGGASAAAAAEEKLDRLRSELDEARQKHDRETQAMRQTLAETQTQHETEADDLRHQLQTAHEEEETLRRRLDEMRDETETARQDLSTFRERAIALEQEAVQLKAAAEENVSLRDEVERSAERLEESERSFRETTEQIRKETLSAIRQSREQAAEATAQLEGLRRELRGAEANGTRLEAELDHQRKQHAAAQAQHRATLEARQKEQRDAEEQHRTSLREAEERLVQLRQETDRRSAQQEREEASLKRRLQRVQEELEESRKRPRVSAETTLELARVRKELDWSEQQRDQLTQRCDEYKSTVIDLRDQLRTQRQSHHVQELRKSLSLQ